VFSGLAQGGHTLPKKHQAPSPLPTPAHSKQFWKILEKESGEAVLESCRRQGITFGHAVYVLCQLAHTMVLHRRRKDMLDGEWEYRIQQPMHFGAPVNSRPYFDPEWLRRGGGTEVFFAITYSRLTLPSMPRIDEGELTYGKFMSQKIFLHRCHSARRQMTNYLKHPLLLQFAALLEQRHCKGKKTLLDVWRARDTIGQESSERPLFPPKSALLGNTGAVLSNGGASFGAVSAECSSK
jgi:hypothetical protein